MFITICLYITNVYLQGNTLKYTETDDDMIKFREESCLLLMKPSERINLDNSGVFLRSLINEKMYSSQIDGCK